MSTHKAIVSWIRSGPDFLNGRYSREHTWTFDGGLTVAASPSPSVVPEPYSNPANRSEERRVGKEGRSRGSPYHLKNKKKKKTRQPHAGPITTRQGTSGVSVDDT